MSLYGISLFLHVVAAIVMFATLGVEWAALYSLRRATTVAQVRDWLRLFGAVGRMGGPAGLTILVTGGYMSVTVWGQQAWIGLGLLGLVAMAVIGGAVTGRRAASLGRLAAMAEGTVRGDLAHGITDPVLQLSAWVRTWLGLGVIYLMTVKPGGAEALTALGVALLVGIALAVPAWTEAGRDARTSEVR